MNEAATKLHSIARIFAISATCAALLACSFSYSFSTGGAPILESVNSLVVVDIYSGRADNPNWPLMQGDVRALARSIPPLFPITCPEPPGNLGYRGFLVRLPGGTIPGASAFQAFRGTIWLGDWPISGRVKSCRSDPSRQVERLLLESGRSHLDPAIYDLLKKEIRPASTAISARATPLVVGLRQS